MKLLIFGGECCIGSLLSILLKQSGHRLTWCEVNEGTPPNLNTYDIVLIIRRSGNHLDEIGLVRRIQRIKDLFPSLPIIVLSYADNLTSQRICSIHNGTYCGITSSMGIQHVKCRLKDLAQSEAEAMLLDALTRLPLEPITFEYQG